jgi:hypothetical protein
MVINLIRTFSKKLQERLHNQTVNEDIRNIEILEIDELFHMFKKTSRVYICLAVDRNRNKVVDIEVTASRDF